MNFQRLYKRFTGLLLLVICKSSFAYSQTNMEHYVKDSVVQVRSIDPDDTLFSDLNLLGVAIGDSKIVMLGEQDHGDSRTFLAKCRIIKYLHEKLGFNVLAFESDFYALNKVWDSVSLKPSQVESTIMNNIFKVWTLCEQFKPVVKYLTDQYQGNNRLQLTGFDNQLVGEYSAANLGWNLSSYITGKGISFSKDEKNMNRFKNTLKSVHTFFYSGKYIKSDSSMQMFSDLDILVDLIIQQLSLDADNLNSFEMQTLSSLQAISDQMIYALNKDYFLADSIRDKQMANNLRWLCTYKYPDQKIIVWAANSHIVKSDSRLLKKKFAKPSSMGYLFSSDPIMQDKTYVIGFTGLQGETGRITSSRKYSISKPEKDGLESWLANKKVIYGFVNFKAFRKRNPADNESFNMRYTNWISVKLPWHNICDGIFYISDMTACQ
jgi:erythromycin esterase